MTNENYTVDILVNDKPLRQFPHDGKLFVEAHKGAEYSIRIKNNSWQRILAVCSVDGLDILNGKKADENGNGYVINGNNSVKIDGFRISDEKVARFLFDYKGGSYAASKEDGSEKNVGVIGVRLFNEKIKPLPPTPIIVREEHHHHHHDYPINPWTPTWNPYGPPTCTLYGSTCNSDPTMDSADNSIGFGDVERERSSGPEKYSCDHIPTKGASRGRTMAGGQSTNMLRSHVKPQGFDMGTRYGESKESRVIEVEFEKGILALTTNIYYASRESLVEMGVPLGNEKQVSFPEPFVGNKYSVPPKDWKG